MQSCGVGSGYGVSDFPHVVRIIAFIAERNFRACSSDMAAMLTAALSSSALIKKQEHGPSKMRAQCYETPLAHLLLGSKTSEGNQKRLPL